MSGAAVALCPPGFEFSVPSNKAAHASFALYGFWTPTLWFLPFVLLMHGLGSRGSCHG